MPPQTNTSRHARRRVGQAALLLGLGMVLVMVGSGGQRTDQVVHATDARTAPVSPQTTAPATSVTPSPRRTPTPAPTPDPTSLQPGTNHNREAVGYVHRAKDVQRWLRDGPQAKGYPRQKIAFLTIDDGPTTSSTSAMLDILKAKETHATFFYLGRREALRPGPRSLPTRTIAEGHSIAVHSYSHDYDFLYPGGVGNVGHVTSDYDKALLAVRHAVGREYVSHAFRYPGGHMSWRGLGASDKALQQKGAYWIDWNIIDGDGDAVPPTTPRAAADRVAVGLAARGNPNVAVVLLHDYPHNRVTIGALPMIIDHLTQQGYEFGVIN